MGEREQNGPETWDPAELVLYAEEYLDQYRYFRRLAEEEESEAGTYREIALSYLEASLHCVQDAIAALENTVANR
jgi:hypothetical protein